MPPESKRELSTNSQTQIPHTHTAATTCR